MDHKKNAGKVEPPKSFKSRSWSSSPKSPKSPISPKSRRSPQSLRSPKEPKASRSNKSIRSPPSTRSTKSSRSPKVTQVNNLTISQSSRLRQRSQVQEMFCPSKPRSATSASRTRATTSGQKSGALSGKGASVLPSNAKLWMAVVAVIVVGAILFTLVRIVRRRRPSALHGESCSSESCQRYTELLRDAVDSNSAPCDNYYKHVCRVWTESHDGPVQSITLGHFIDNAIEGIKSLPSIHDVVTRKGTVFFASCLSVANVSNVPNVKKLLADGDITWPKRNDQPDFLNALFYMSRILFMPVFFNFKVSPNGKVLKVSHSEDFSEIFLLLHQHMKTLHLKKYLTVTYEAFDTLDETRLGEIIARFDQLIPVIENITGWEDANVYNAATFLGITPSVPRDRWDTSLLRFTSFDIISTFHTSSDVAGEWLQRKCFFSTFLFFGFDVDRYFLSKSGDALSNVRQLAKRVRQEFFAVLEGGDNEPGSHRGEQAKRQRVLLR
ncbi:hypothetical protein MRX96_013106 [Rhipicephalus microplus]